MDMITQELDQWLSSLPARHPVAWEQLPDIGLYMDQVLTYVDRQLGLYRQTDQEHVLTPAMINNYIKDNLLPRAELKKYAPTHLAILTTIGALKQVLSMQDLQTLLSGLTGPEAARDFYDRFLNGQNRVVSETVQSVAHRLSDVGAGNTYAANEAVKANEEDEAKEAKESAEAVQSAAERQLRDLALDLAIEARIRILISEQILTSLTRSREEARKKAASADASARAAKSKSKKEKASEE